MEFRNFGFTLVVLSFLVLSATVNAATQRAPASSSKESVSTITPRPIHWDAAAAVAVVDGTALPGLNVGLAEQVLKTVPTYVGFEFSSYFHTTTNRGALIPALVVGYVEFDVAPKVKPTLGLLTGPAFSVNTPGQDHVEYALLFRPGVDFVLAPGVGLNFQSRFGVIGSNFVFIPQLGTTITL